MESFFHDNPDLPVSVNISRFRGHSGVDEYHLAVYPVKSAGLEVQIDWLFRAYMNALNYIGLDEKTVLLRRFFCSFLPNQAAALKEQTFASLCHKNGSCAVSWVCQPPFSSAKISLWAYHVRDANNTLDRVKENNSLILRRGKLTHYWTTGIICPTADTPHGQTLAIFKKYDAFLSAHGMSLNNNVMRTWFFLQNIETNYGEFVAARREFFAAHGLTKDTHFISSTGIEGLHADISAKVEMDAYAISGLETGQIRFLAAPDHLSSTHIYGVTFERGTSIAYLDRSHVLISGTASIDEKGSVMYKGDVLRQLDRAIENIEVLLGQAGATLKDIGVLIIYIRNSKDYGIIWQTMQKRFGNTPMVAVRARICRPEWLVEVECVAVISSSNPELPSF